MVGKTLKTNMAYMYCEGCEKNHQDWAWKNTTKTFDEGERKGWFCQDWFKPTSADFTPDRIKEQRKIHGKDLIQPWRGGEPNKEFVKEYPHESKSYFTDKEIRKAKKKL